MAILIFMAKDWNSVPSCSHWGMEMAKSGSKSQLWIKMTDFLLDLRYGSHRLFAYLVMIHMHTDFHSYMSILRVSDKLCEVLSMCGWEKGENTGKRRIRINSAFMLFALGPNKRATFTSFSYWISNIALELPRSCITDSACFSSSSRFIVLWKKGEGI